jgi:hypothetical protein
MTGAAEPTPFFLRFRERGRIGKRKWRQIYLATLGIHL